MNPAGFGTKNDCPGDSQQQFTLPTDCAGENQQQFIRPTDQPIGFSQNFFFISAVRVHAPYISSY
jgi:hypothetical protein